MLNITHYQRNANQNHSEVPLHASQDGCYPKAHSSILAWRIPGTEEPGRPQSIESQRIGHNWSNLAHTHLTAMQVNLEM